MDRGILKAKFLKYMYEARLGFPEGCGIQTKKRSRLGGGVVLTFSETTQR